MAKSRKKKTVDIEADDIISASQKLKSIANGDATISILSAEIKDDLCIYSYEIVSGKPTGFIHNVKGKGIVDEDMKTAFSKLNVHLAVIDDVFKHSDIQIGDIDQMHNEDLTLLFTVTGFKVKGGEDNMSVILVGNKYLSAGSRMKLESPKIPIDNLSSYKWYNELNIAIENCREEVKAYHNGKYTPIEQEEDEPEDSRQLTIGSEEAIAENSELEEELS